MSVISTTRPLALPASKAVSWPARLRRWAPGLVLLLMVAHLALGMLLAGDDAFRDSDEQRHALVARALWDHPLTPALLARPNLDGHLPEAYDVWRARPPLASYLAALSMGILGPSAPVLRLPAVLLSMLCVGLTFALGVRLLNTPAALLAAFAQAVAGPCLLRAAGYSSPAAPDPTLLFLIELGLLAAVLDAAPLAPEATLPVINPLVLCAAVATGLALGAGTPVALVVPAAYGLLLPVRPWRRQGGRVALKLAVLLLIALLLAVLWHPRFWGTLTSSAPPLSAWKASRVALAKPLRGLVFAGSLASLVAIVWFAARTLRHFAARALRMLLAWLVVPPLCVWIWPDTQPQAMTVALPAVFLMLGWAVWEVWRWPVRRAWLRGVALALALGAAAVPVAQSALTVVPLTHIGPWRQPGATARPPTASQWRTLAAQVDDPDAVLFGVPDAALASFYTTCEAYTGMPTEKRLIAARAAHRTVVVLQAPGTHVPAALQGVDGVRVLKWTR